MAESDVSGLIRALSDVFYSAMRLGVASESSAAVNHAISDFF
jgi:hypothetical protein